MVLRGELRPGEKLLSEREPSERFHVSRGTLQEEQEEIFQTLLNMQKMKEWRCRWRKEAMENHLRGVQRRAKSVLQGRSEQKLTNGDFEDAFFELLTRRQVEDT